MMFLRNIMLAIARLLGHTTPPLDNPVQPTQTVGRASKAPTQPRGNKRSAQTSTQQRQSATKKSSSKRSVAQSTTVASSRKAKPKPAQPAAKASGATGKQSATRASKTRQHAK